MREATIAVIGLGYVGLPLALLANRKGYPVIGIDADPAKISKLQRGEMPFAETDLQEQLQQASIVFTKSFEHIPEAEIVIICVPTPVDENALPDLSPLRNACDKLAEYLRPGQLVILESTVNPGVSESVVLPLLEDGSGLRGGRDFKLAHCPERINPGDAVWNVSNIPRVVGSIDNDGLTRATRFYRSIISGEVRSMSSLKEAEAVKIVENSFRDINIAFVNELAMSFDKLGIDVVQVIEGAATKPFAFLPHFPGCGVGGHCIPVDPYYLIEYARQNGFDHEFLKLARNINRRMPFYTAELTARMLGRIDRSIEGARVVVLGLSYKSDIDDVRESPAYTIVEALEEMGADVGVFDPYVTQPVTTKRRELAEVVTQPGTTQPEEVLFEIPKSGPKSLEEALEGAVAVVVATGHRLFRETDPMVLRRAGVKVVVDGRNCLDRARVEEAGMIYKGIGH